ncbi:MAG: D-tyrosyl-tRNA(Tyr) deacylase [Planctomycetota bacterium]|nr:MAG: D-tyrosyl-tRNA(Tyr) deacylase [Planctomycetota bacterium]
MKALLQRVDRAQVTVNKEVVGSIQKGLLIYLGCCKFDGPEEAKKLARRVAGYRLFADQAGRTNLDVNQVKGEVLVVSQFTLSADTRKGRRPSFDSAMEPSRARELVELFCQTLRDLDLVVAEGAFGEEMSVASVNHGPATYLLEIKPHTGQT